MFISLEREKIRSPRLLPWSLFVAVRDFVYPPLCLVCSVRLDDGSESVCDRCWSGFRRVKAGDTVWDQLHERFQIERSVKSFVSCFYLDEGPMQKVVHLLKYQGMKTLGTRLGRDVGRAISANPVLSKADLLIPVPLHRRKLRERGYNQSEFICVGISETTGISTNPSILVRKKCTRSQTQLTLQERRENVGDAFGLEDRHKNAVSGKAVILIDDVITTGSTMSSCAGELVRAGAGAVYAASAAAAP